MTIKDFKNTICKEIAALYDKNESLNIANYLLEERLGMNKSQLLIHSNDIILDQLIEELQQDLLLLKKAMPIQQILGYTFFYGLKINVTKHTLIPRPETEELVSIIIEYAKNNQALKLLDIGTGSACIALALKSQLPNTSVNAMDISESALITAKQNAQINQLNIGFFQADILSLDIPDSFLENDIIVSNPPYIHINEKEQIHANVLNYEPHSALFVYDDDVLLFYKKIIQFAQEKNKKNACLFFEMNELYGEELIAYMKSKNILDVELIKDMQGKNRFIKAAVLVN